MSEFNSSIATSEIFRLPRSVIPNYYNLTLTPNIDKFSFDGHLDIEIDIKQSLKIISLHSKELNIYNVKLRTNRDVEHIYFATNDIKYDMNKTLANLVFNSTISSGNEYRLSMDFRGSINTRESYGFYYSNLTDTSNRTHHLLSTQFEHNYARRAFPCWDEPGFKAKFDVALLVPKDLTALSNTKVKQLTKHKNNWHYQFETTPIMSTYILSYAIGDLEYIEATAPGYHRDEPIRCRMYTLRGFSNQTRVAMDATIKSLGFFEEYFDIPYTLDKMDLIAVPNHDVLAMENWGLVTVKHSEMVLVDDNNEKARNKAIFTVTHEMAHQWFGNLATPKIWDDLWLNEAFATYFGNLASELLYPKHGFENFLNGFYIQYLDFLSEERLSPIRLNNQEPEGYSRETSLTIYGKGAVMLDVLNRVISNNKFKEFTRAYLKKFKFSAASSTDVYSILSKLSNFDMKQFANTWIESKNYPFLTVTEESVINNQTKLIITQSPYVTDTKNPLWYVPFELITNDDKPESQILSNQSISVNLPKGTQFNVIPAGFGYVKVNYNLTANSRFYEQVANPKATIFKDHDRKDLIKNTIQFFKAGKTDAIQVLNLFQGFIDSNVEIISSLIDSSKGFMRMWSNLPEFVSFFKPIQNKWYSKFNPSIDWLAELDDDNSTQLIGQEALLHSVINGNNNLLSDANSRFQQFIKGNIDVVSPSMRPTLFKMVLTQKDSSIVNHILSMFDTELTKKHEGLGFDILTSLGYCHPNQLETILSWATKNKGNRLAWVISYFRPDKDYGRYAWNYIKKHWSELKDFDSDHLEFVISAVTSNMFTPDLVNPAVTFLNSQNRPELRDAIVRLIQQGKTYDQNINSVKLRLNPGEEREKTESI